MTRIRSIFRPPYTVVVMSFICDPVPRKHTDIIRRSYGRILGLSRLTRFVFIFCYHDTRTYKVVSERYMLCPPNGAGGGRSG